MTSNLEISDGIIEERPTLGVTSYLVSELHLKINTCASTYYQEGHNWNFRECLGISIMCIERCLHTLFHFQCQISDSLCNQSLIHISFLSTLAAMYFRVERDTLQSQSEKEYV